MAEAQDDYWPSDIAQTNITTPVSLMRTQATLLGTKTNQQITAKVQPMGGLPAQFVWSFQLTGSALGNYKYELFRVSHPFLLYPVTIVWEGHPDRLTQNVEEFKDALKEILGSDQTKHIVHSLLSQVIS